MNRQASTPFFKIRPTKEIERPGLPALLKSVVTCSSVEVSPQSRVDFERTDRKSTRLNSSHGYISYAVFCLKNTVVAIDSSRASARRRLCLSRYQLFGQARGERESAWRDVSRRKHFLLHDHVTGEPWRRTRH